jgi:siroheme synthase
MNEEVLLPEHSAEQTLCIYMGIEALPKLILQLVNQGFSANTKIAVIS